MNKNKILGGGVAMVAVLALIGGGTFAGWSDYQTEDVEIAAGTLTLSVDEQGVVTPGDLQDIYPGATRTRNHYLASNDNESSPDGDLYLTVQNIDGTENGCDSNTEEPDQLAKFGSSCDDTSGDWDPDGQLAEEVNVQVQVFTTDQNGDPITDSNTCASSQTGSATTVIGGGPNTFTSLAGTEDVKHLIFEDLEPGQGICFRMEITMPSPSSGRYDTGATGFDGNPTPNVTNASQGDEAEFELLFDLEQAF